MKISATLLGVLFALLAGSAASAQTGAQAGTCKNDASATASVDFVSEDLPAAGTALQTQNNPTIEVGLRKKIYLHVDKLADLLAEFDNCRLTQPTKQIVLYLDGLPIKDLTGTLPRPRADGFLEFYLVRTSAAKDAWNRIMSRPLSPTRLIPISIGYADQAPIRSGLSINFVIVPQWEAFLAIGFWVVVVAVFIGFAKTTSIIRDGSPTASFSLARTQAAWWFFIILGAFMFVAAATGDVNGALSGTALTLLGIGAATAGASAVVNSSQAGEQQAAEHRVQAQIADQTNQVAAIQAQVGQAGAAAQAAAQARLDAANAVLARKRSLLQQLRTPYEAENFLKDILSDADGISVHRFQMVAWTLVLSFIFAKQVFDTMAMPDFDANLLTLQGISAATYVGLKMAEPSVPKEARTA